MGCCQSRAASESPYALSNDSSRAAINPSAHAHSNASPDTARSSRPTATAAGTRTPDASLLPPPIPLQPPVPVRHSPRTFSHHQPPWSRRILEQQRKEFFDTRTSYRREIWNALEVAAESIRRGDLAQAQAIMDAANVTCPTGRFARGRGKDRQHEGVYDDRGKLYDIPWWIVADPDDIVDGGDEKDGGGATDHEDSAGTDHVRRAEKGKGRAEDVGEEIRVTARLNTAHDVTVTVGRQQSVGAVKRTIEQQEGIRIKRLIHLGKILELGPTLENAGWKEGQILNAFVHDSGTDPAAPT